MGLLLDTQGSEEGCTDLVDIPAGQALTQALAEHILRDGRTNREADYGSERAEEVRDRCGNCLVFGARICDQRDKGGG